MTYNPIIIWLLYSPLHRILSGKTMVVGYVGRKSGRRLRVPVGYLRMNGELLTASYKHRKWWRNLRGGAPVILRLQGQDVDGLAEIIEDEQGVIEGIRAFIGGNPLMARMFRVSMSRDGQLDEAALRAAANERVIVRTMLR